MPTTKSSEKGQASRPSLKANPPAPAKESRKRKGDANLPKFYAVRAGRKPGVYLTWDECLEQTAGFGGASHKSFTNRDDAEAFVAGTKASGGGGECFYAVAVGREPGIYTNWDEASRTIKGCTGPKYRKFKTHEDALDYIRASGNADAQEWLSKNFPEPRSKKAKHDDEMEELQIFTDGSSLANGRAGAVAGVGVYFGEGDARNVSERLQGQIQTNQRAELTAVIRALEATQSVKKIRILTDSQYSINCATNWYQSWERNDWKKSNGEPVMNQDLVKQIRVLIDKRDEAGLKTGFQWVKGHSTNAGNIAADRLAVAGARKRS